MSPGDATDGPDDPVDAVTYHERTKHAPESLGESDYSMDFDNQPRPYKIYRNLPTRALPDEFTDPDLPALEAIADSTGAASDDAGIPDLDALASLAFHANGITREIDRQGETLLFRAAACTGKLYHVDCYAITGDLRGSDDPDLPDLPAGVYHFDPRSSSLDVLRKGDHRAVLAAASDHDAVREAPITFVATSTWWRNAWKYRARTFRHAFWDSGTILANLLATAHALDLPATVVAGFADDPVADLLGVDPTHEAPLELVPVGAGDPVSASSDDPPEIDPIDPETEPLSPTEHEFPLIHRAWRAGVVDDGPAATEWRSRLDPGEQVGTRPAGDGDRIALDPVDRQTASSRPLANTIRRRGSCREYEHDAISFRKLSTVLDRSFRGVPMDVRSDADGSSPALCLNDAYLVVNDVTDLPPGAYHYHPDEGDLERLTGGDLADRTERESRERAQQLALGQPLGGDAAVCIYFLTDVDEVVEDLGDRGYRAAQLEASITAGRLYLAAYAHRDLGATGLTFFDDQVTDCFSPRAAGQTPTFLLTVGRPA